MKNDSSTLILFIITGYTGGKYCEDQFNQTSMIHCGYPGSGHCEVVADSSRLASSVRVILTDKFLKVDSSRLAPSIRVILAVDIGKY